MVGTWNLVRGATICQEEGIPVLRAQPVGVLTLVLQVVQTIHGSLTQVPSRLVRSGIPHCRRPRKVPEAPDTVALSSECDVAMHGQDQNTNSNVGAEKNTCTILGVPHYN